MSKVRQVSDTFVHYLADNLTGIPVHVLREDATDPSACKLQMNAVNIQFLTVTFGDGTRVGSFQIVIDVVNDDSNTMLDWIEAVRGILTASFTAPVLDYTTPASPVATGSNIYWDGKSIGFKRVSASDNYAHFTCTLPVRFRSI